jgi:hypothetical protein
MPRRARPVQHEDPEHAANLWSSSAYAIMPVMVRGVAVALLPLLFSCSARDAPPAQPDATPPLGRAEPATSGEGLPAGDAGGADTGADARHDFQLPLPDPRSVKASPAAELAALSPAKCRAELKKRGIASKPAGLATPGVATPLRLSDKVQGVEFLAPGGRSKFGVLDCRLALALDELTRVLGRHQVSAVVVDNFYRPQARMSGTKNPSQHAHGLAVDIMGFKLVDGRTLVVKKDWHGEIAAPVCGPASRPVEPTREALTLWNMVCEIARERIFHHMLTPNNDAAHADHLHFDIKRDARSFLVR